MQHYARFGGPRCNSGDNMEEQITMDLLEGDDVEMLLIDGRKDSAVQAKEAATRVAWEEDRERKLIM